MGPTSHRGLLGVELREGELQLVIARRSAVVLDLVLHEGDAFALHGPRDDRGGPAFRAMRLVDRSEDLTEGVAVERGPVPVERPPLLRERLEGHDVLRATLL